MKKGPSAALVRRVKQEMITLQMAEAGVYLDVARECLDRGLSDLALQYLTQARDTLVAAGTEANALQHRIKIQRLSILLEDPQ